MKNDSEPPKMDRLEASVGRQIEMRHTSVSWQGPIPPPAMVREYNEIIPNGAERIFAQVENETAHRHKLETRLQTFPLIEQITARAFALVFALACLAACIYAIDKSAYWVAAILGGAMIINGINAFMKRGYEPSTKQPKPQAQSKQPNKKKT